MKGRTWLTYLCSIGLVVLLLAGFGTVLAQQGSADDPLVTLSYLNNQLTPALLQQVDSNQTQRALSCPKSCRPKWTAYLAAAAEAPLVKRIRW